jgi:hypothetical protein
LRSPILHPNTIMLEKILHWLIQEKIGTTTAFTMIDGK